MGACVRRWAAVLTLAAAGPAGAVGDPEAGQADKVRRLTAAIDRHLAADWSARQVVPAPDADDGEFLRRVSLDVAGRIPKVAEARAFLADRSPDKRARAVDRLLASPAHAAHFAAVTRADWVPPSDADFRVQQAGNQFEEWLRRQYAANARADDLARALLTAKVAVGQRGRFGFDDDGADPANRDLTALAGFYQAADVKPENLAATVSRVFLGVKLECAQCHDHPFAPYTRDQFWQFAAFFGEFTPLPPVAPSFVGPLLPQSDSNRLPVPNTSKTVTASYLDGEAPDWSPDRTPRQELAGWLTAKENPYFARNLANRAWAHLLGTGLVDPVDEPGDSNPPSHPGLLDELAAGVADAGFDRRVLIRAIAGSRAYNLTSRQTDPSQADPRRFARAAVRGLTADQIYDSFLAATGARDTAPRARQPFADRGDAAGRAAFGNLFAAAVPKPAEAQTSILQALMLMNGKSVADQTTAARGDVLGAVADAPFLSPADKVEALFLAALTRPPTPAERDKYTTYVDRGGPSGDRTKALADVFWVLLNSTEFLFNH